MGEGEYNRKDVISFVYESIGQASMCWEYPEWAATFDTDQADKIANALCKFINKKINKTNNIKENHVNVPILA